MRKKRTQKPTIYCCAFESRWSGQKCRKRQELLTHIKQIWRESICEISTHTFLHRHRHAVTKSFSVFNEKKWMNKNRNVLEMGESETERRRGKGKESSGGRKETWGRERIGQGMGKGNEMKIYAISQVNVCLNFKQTRLIVSFKQTNKPTKMNKWMNE